MFKRWSNDRCLFHTRGLSPPVSPPASNDILSVLALYYSTLYETRSCYFGPIDFTMPWQTWSFFRGRWWRLHLNVWWRPRPLRAAHEGDASSTDDDDDDGGTVEPEPEPEPQQRCRLAYAYSILGLPLPYSNTSYIDTPTLYHQCYIGICILLCLFLRIGLHTAT